MILRGLALLFMALVILGTTIAIDIKAWFFWIAESHGRLVAYGAVTVFALVWAVIIRIAVKLEEKSR